MTLNHLKWLFFTLFCFQTAFAQNLVLQNSGEMRTKALQLYESKKIDAAIALLEEVYPGDTNYVAVQILAARMEYERKNYHEAKAHIQKAQRMPSAFGNEIYNILGLSYHNLQQPDSADYCFSEGLRLFPFDYLLQYNQGIVLHARGQFEAAIKYFRRTIEINPWYGPPHYMLGYMAARAKRPTQALMAWGYYVYLVEGNSGTLGEIERLSNGTLKYDAELRIANASWENDFEALDELISARLALRDGYKTGIKLKGALVNQYKLFYEKFRYRSESDDPFMQLYGEHYRNLQQQNHFESFVRVLANSVDIDENDKWIKKNRSKWSKTYDITNTTISRHIDRQQLRLDGQALNLECWYSNRKIEAIGEVQDGNSEKRVGTWYFIRSNGSIQASGPYQNFKRHGTWRFYHDEGWLEYLVDFENGERHGAYKVYHRDGGLITTAFHREGKAEDTARYYFPCGSLRKVVRFVDDEQEGVELTYFASGKLESRGFYRRGVYNDSAFTYYENGRPNMRLFYNNEGKLHGWCEQYHPNGQLMNKGQYDNGQQVGEWVYYYANGQLERKGAFDANGDRMGRWDYFEENGVIDRVMNFEAGYMRGRQEYYDSQGELVRVVMAADSSRFLQEIYYDEQGKERATYGNEKGDFEVVAYQRSGWKRSEGQMKNGFYEGTWRTYYRNGHLERISNYRKGIRHGAEIQYNEHGKVVSEANYVDDQLDGLYRLYYNDGTLRRQGYYVNGTEYGRWEGYHENGKLMEVFFVEDGDVNGPAEVHAAIGGVKRLETYAYDAVRSERYFNRQGLEYHRNDLPAGNAEVKWPYLNGAARLKATIYCDRRVDSVFMYSKNGAVIARYFYVMGDREGPQYDYYQNGQLKIRTDYKENKEHGIQQQYFANGKLEWSGQFEAGKQVGTWKFYHQNGKLRREETFNANGRREGWIKLYDQLGELMYEKRYQDGNPVAIRYLLPSGKFSDPISLEVDSISYTTYFKNGKVSAKETYYMTYYDGEQTYYHSDGSLLDRFTMNMGVKQGAFEEGDKAGILRKKGSYRNDDLEGVIHTYDERGKLLKEETYHAGWLEGPATYYGADGKVSSKVFNWSHDSEPMD